MNETLPRHSIEWYPPLLLVFLHKNQPEATFLHRLSCSSIPLQINTQTPSHPRMLALGDLTVQITPGNGSPNLEVIGGSN